ncbi:hypothetical protein KCP69_01010 [Salmonella enterica subsp. enterica]|nr:hypothetical protein KCP69_01010 [Salmonella enterica subsp. enterica]
MGPSAPRSDPAVFSRRDGASGGCIIRAQQASNMNCGKAGDSTFLNLRR